MEISFFMSIYQIIILKYTSFFTPNYPEYIKLKCLPHVREIKKKNSIQSLHHSVQSKYEKEKKKIHRCGESVKNTAVCIETSPGFLSPPQSSSVALFQGFRPKIIGGILSFSFSGPSENPNSPGFRTSLLPGHFLPLHWQRPVQPFTTSPLDYATVSNQFPCFPPPRLVV